MFKAVKRDKLDKLMHSAKGTTWSDHKYIAIKNGRYIYPEEAKRGLNKLRQNNRNLGNDRGIPAKKNIYENPTSTMPSEARRGLSKLFYNKEKKHTFNLDTTKYPFNKINRDEQAAEMKKEHEEARKRRNQKSSEADQLKNDPRFQKKDATVDDAYKRLDNAIKNDPEHQAMRKQYDAMAKEIEQKQKEQDALRAEMENAHEEFEKKIEQGEMDRKEARARMQKYQDAFDKSWNETIDMMNKQRAIMKGMMLGFTRPVSSIVKALTYKKNK